MEVTWSCHLVASDSGGGANFWQKTISAQFVHFVAQFQHFFCIFFWHWCRSLNLCKEKLKLLGVASNLQQIEKLCFPNWQMVEKCKRLHFALLLFMFCRKNKFWLDLFQKGKVKTIRSAWLFIKGKGDKFSLVSDKTMLTEE